MVSAFRQLVVLLPSAYLLSKTGNLNLVWFAFPISEMASVFLSYIGFRYVYKKEINPLDDEFQLSVNDEYYTNVSYISMLNIECKILTTFLFANEGMIRLETPVETVISSDGTYINLSVTELGSVYLNNSNNNVNDISVDDIVQTIISDDKNNLSEFKTYSNSMIENRLLEVNADITEVSDNLSGVSGRVDYLEKRETYLTESLNNIKNLPQLSFNESGELVVTINGVSKTFVPKE